MRLETVAHCAMLLADSNFKIKTNCTSNPSNVDVAQRPVSVITVDPLDLIGPSLFHQGRAIIQSVTAWDLHKTEEPSLIIRAGSWCGRTTPAINELREEATLYMLKYNRTLTFARPKTKANQSGAGTMVTVHADNSENDKVFYSSGFATFLQRRSKKTESTIVFINRDYKHKRHVTNGVHAVNVLRRMGFQTHYISDMANVPDARRLIQTATVIISPHGQQMFNMLWAPAQALCIELFASHMYTNMYRLLLENSNHKWDYVYSNTSFSRCKAKHKEISRHGGNTRKCIRDVNFEVNVDELFRVIRTALRF